MPILTNASPRNVALGTNDLSGRIVKPTPRQYPQHLPIIFLYTEKGGYKREQVDGGEFAAMYGVRSLDPRSKYFNHATALAVAIFNAGGQVIVQRLRVRNAVPDIINDSRVAGVTVFASVAMNPAAYGFVRDSLGKTEESPVFNSGVTINAAEITYLTVPYVQGQDLSAAGIGADGDTFIKDYTGGAPIAATSKLYPLFTIKSTGESEYYNNLGFNIAPLTGDDEDTDVTEKLKAFAYEIGVSNKSTGVKRDVTAITGDRKVPFVFKDGATHPVTNKAFSFTDVFPDSFGNLTDPDIDLLPYDFEDVVILSTFQSFLNDMRDIELQAQADATVEPFFDFVDETLTGDDKSNLINFISLRSTDELRYEGLRVTSEDVTSAALTTAEAKRIDISSDTPIYLANGLDGNVKNLPLFETMVMAEIAVYSNKDSEIIDTALNKESIFYDSGFSLDNKLLMNQFTFFRRDIIPVIGTYVFNEANVEQSLSEAISYASLIKTAISLAPESKVFGTSSARGLIVMGSGKLSNGTYKYALPQTVDLAVRATRYMGAGNGKWKGRYRFSRQPGNVITELIDLKPSFIPESIKAKLWKTGMIWTQADDRVTYFYPATQTIYNDDTSILNIFTVMVGISYIVKLNDAAWRTFTGATDLSNAELKEAVETFITDNLLDAFDKQLTVIPEVTITAGDDERGYSWHLKVKVYANNQKTVMVSHIEAHRASDLLGA